MTERSSNFKRISSVFNSEIINIKFKSDIKESIIVTITRNTMCHIQTKTEVRRLCGREVGTGQEFVKFLGQDFNHVLFSHFRLFLLSDLKKVDQLT